MQSEANAGVATDWRLSEHRRRVFLDFYSFHLEHRAHPGCVYYLMPYLRDRYGWDEEEALWFAFLNGNTQNPVTSLLLHRRAPRPADAEALIDFWNAEYDRLAFDTDRRYHKKNLAWAIEGYRTLTNDHQAAFWADTAARGFPAVWAAATAIPSFGRLSAFSYAEYLRVMGVDFDCDSLFLDDIPGSRSHRNGLCIVLGLDRYDWHASNPDFPGAYPRDLLWMLAGEGQALREHARAENQGNDWEHDVSYFTLESALCTYKSWHRPNRRYPNVYNDMLYDRIRAAEKAWPDEDLDVFWEARADRLPTYLRLEDTPGDPGCVPAKQNHYRETGEVIVMGRNPRFARYHSSFDADVESGQLGTYR